MYQVRTLVNAVEVGGQFVPTAGTVVNMLDSDYQRLSARSFGVNTTLAASASAGATSISTVVSPAVGDVVNIDTGTIFETVYASAVSGVGPYTVTVSALRFAHASGAVVTFNGILSTVGQVPNTSDVVNIQATHVNAPAALTAVAAVGATPTKAEYDALLADVTAVRTTLTNTLTALQGTSKPMA